MFELPPVKSVTKRIAQLYHGLAAGRKGSAGGIPGMRFDAFGRRLGLRMLARGHLAGWRYLVNPVSIVRYWEFDFAERHVPRSALRALDVSSPRLFALGIAESRPDLSIDLFNPDASDTRLSIDAARILRQTRVHPRVGDVEAVPSARTYDVAWSLSVVEHISGADGDSDAVRRLASSLCGGASLIVTVPVDRRYRLEFRENDPYGTQAQAPDGSFFFQRWYDQRALEERLIGASPELKLQSMEFFGEIEPGHFDAYEREWLRVGLDRTVMDPIEILENFVPYQSWDEMPGMGVCGLHFRRESNDSHVARELDHG